MRYSQEHKAQTYRRIVKEASARFRRDGVAATGLQPLMKALGLTHGGFYAHFESKQALVETALQDATEEMQEVFVAATATPKPIESLLERYLSEAHRDHPERGCPLTTIAAELGQRGEPSESVDAAVLNRLAIIASHLTGENRDARAASMLSSMVGALILSRSVKDPALSNRILQDAKRRLVLEAEHGSGYPEKT